MQQKKAGQSAARVLVATQAGIESIRLVEFLREAGYSVQRAPDVAAALKVIHANTHPLIVMLDATSTRLINTVLTSRRLLHHHAYVLIAHEPPQLAPAYMALCARLTLFIVRVPFTRDQLLHVLAQASRSLTVDYPAAPVAGNDPKASRGGTYARRYSAADGEQTNKERPYGIDHT